MSITVTFDRARLVAQLRAMPNEGRALLGPWLKKNAALVVSSTGKYKGMVQATPPFRLGDSDSATTARKYGEAKVSAQIWRVYGTPRKLYEAVKTKAGLGAANGFWARVQRGDIAGANTIARNATGYTLDAFDDGAEHKRRRVRGQVTGRDPTSFTTRRQWIEAYVKQKQRLVGLLASALVAPGRATLGQINGVPPFVARHSLPGSTITHTGSADGESYLMTITTPYGPDLQRLAESVIRFRVAAMALSLPHVIRAAQLLP